MNSTIKPSACKTCGSFYHSAMYHKPRKLIISNPGTLNRQTPLPKPKKRIKQQGKVAEDWHKAKLLWIKNNMPIGSGIKLPCHYCGVILSWGNITLDHKIPRSRAPELRTEPSNLVPCCYTCNGLKGSVDHDHYKHNCPDDTQQGIT